MKRNEDHSGAVAGCFILVIGFCSLLGGLLYFFQILITMIHSPIF